jgi:hypothetical protein
MRELFTVSYDISNHKPVKQFRILVHYFQGYDLENQVKHELMTFVEISGETANIIFMEVMEAVSNYDKCSTIISR